MSNSKMTDRPIDLYRGTRGPIDGLSACKRAADQAKGRPLYILAYTPDFCGFVTLQDGGLAPLDGPKKGAFDAGALFELRCFCEAFELRWLQGDGDGQAVLLSEDQAQLEGFDTTKLEGPFYELQNHYVLWGKEERGRLFEHRVGELPLPGGVDIPPRGRVYLNFTEYFREDKYGNLRWHSERLTGFAPAIDSESQA